MNFSNINSPIWLNADHTMIGLTLDIQSDILARNFIQVRFNASPNDVEPHGVELFNRAANGEFGAIADFVPTAPAPDIVGFTNEIKLKLGILEINQIATLYPLFFPAVQSNAWQDVEVLIADAVAKNIVSASQHLILEEAAVKFNIPIILTPITQ